jgi:hypothetical protein
VALTFLVVIFVYHNLMGKIVAGLLVETHKHPVLVVNRFLISFVLLGLILMLVKTLQQHLWAAW